MRWQFESSISGYGALSDLGTHALDLARYLVGEVAAVAGAQSDVIKERPDAEGSRKKKGKVNVDDLTVATMKFKNGALGTLETSWVNPGPDGLPAASRSTGRRARSGSAWNG